MKFAIVIPDGAADLPISELGGKTPLVKGAVLGKLLETNFGSYAVRRLEAEVLIDAINKITGTSDLYTSAIPEPFTYIPEDKPAIASTDFGSKASAFWKAAAAALKSCCRSQRMPRARCGSGKSSIVFGAPFPACFAT